MNITTLTYTCVQGDQIFDIVKRKILHNPRAQSAYKTIKCTSRQNMKYLKIQILKLEYSNN